MSIDKKNSYTHKLSWQKDKVGKLSADKKDIIDIATPVDFGGPSGFWSPEDLFVASVNSCIMTTFLYFIEKRKIKLLEYESQAEGFIEKKDSKLTFSEIIIKSVISVAKDDFQKVKKIAELAKKHCLVSNSINCPVKFIPKIVKT
jgi:organic hydroperoxide reductase OsmC/OhrA